MLAAITQVKGATVEVYDEDGTTPATQLATGTKIIVTAQDGTTKVTYTVTVNDPPSSGGGSDGGSGGSGSTSNPHTLLLRW